MLPKVLIGGFPNSGTSFLCNLVAEMGFSPGSKKNLKPADVHNRWGYWEHLPIRKLTWSAVSFLRPRLELPSFWQLPRPSLEDLQNHPNKTKIRELAQRDNIEVYKDNLLPLLYTLFEPNAKYLFIERNHKEIFRSGGYELLHRGKLTIDNFYRCYKMYYKLVQKMSKRVDCLTVNYDDFRTNLEDTVSCIAVFLDADDINLRKLHKVFRPREEG